MKKKPIKECPMTINTINILKKLAFGKNVLCDEKIWALKRLMIYIKRRKK